MDNVVGAGQGQNVARQAAIRKGHALGLAGLCIGGGQGMATVLERI